MMINKAVLTNRSIRKNRTASISGGEAETQRKPFVKVNIQRRSGLWPPVQRTTAI
ncbi:hypothetical protein [Sinorhizobium medicae]|uniref:hypothetical protein n=1 Tax=Sinorhizobium medicae TaxID=110321 RepID=UPI0018659515|nr:hypothetical protein [Sinorhizobium medicae]WQO64130.1 hypothetical protein U8C40_13200 [Sinorhizobium medicae]